MKPAFKVGDSVIVSLPAEETLDYGERTLYDIRIDGPFNQIIHSMYTEFNNRRMKIESITVDSGIELIYLEHGMDHYWRAEWLILDNNGFYGELQKLIQNEHA